MKTSSSTEIRSILVSPSLKKWRRSVSRHSNSLVRSLVALIALAVYADAGAKAPAHLVVSDDGLVLNGQIVLRGSDLPSKLDEYPDAFLGQHTIPLAELSPVANEIAFVARGANHDWVGLFTPASRKIRTLFPLYGGTVAKLVWSSAGVWLAIESEEPSGFRDVTVYNVRRSTKYRLSERLKRDDHVDLSEPRWSDDGRKISVLISEGDTPHGSRESARSSITFEVSDSEVLP